MVQRGDLRDRRKYAMIRMEFSIVCHCYATKEESQVVPRAILCTMVLWLSVLGVRTTLAGGNPQQEDPRRVYLPLTIAATTETTASPTPSPDQSLTAQLIDLVNKERANAGCTPLALSVQLGVAAQEHSADMAQNDYFSHTSSDGRQLWDRVKGTGYKFTMVGENIARGQVSAKEVMQAWMSSTSHSHNILNCEYREIGIGYASHTNSANDPFWTQVFAAPGQ
jgi:uncharacterized protein YkwD